MILELNVENIAVIERAQIKLGPGFSVMTGETGAGKSLLIDAIALALGDRADSDLVRSGASRGTVSLVADLSTNPAAKLLCESLGVEIEDDQLFVQREVSVEGRSTCRIGGKQQPVGVLKQIGNLLVDLHGQHDHQALLDPVQHLEYLDLWIGAQATGMKARVAQALATWDKCRASRVALEKGLRDREHRIDLLEHQIREIESVSPIAGELAELENELNRLKHAEKLSLASSASLARLADEEGCGLDALLASVAELENASRFDPTLEEVLDPIQQALAFLQEGVVSLRDYHDQIDQNPDALQEVAERIDAVKRLIRKYGDTEEAVLDYLATSSDELALLQDSAGSAEELRAREESARADLVAVCGELRAMRTAASVEFSRQVVAEIRELAMEKAVFSLEMSPVEPTANGADVVQYLFSANPGEEPRALDRIASGGEMSRVMLALKVVLAGKAGVPTLIFDEIDTGLSGRAAAVVAKKLEVLARNYQVISISHLPQLAARALTQFKIEKAELQGRTFTQVRVVGEEDRVVEVARMLAGEQIGENALANARELLAQRDS